MLWNKMNVLLFFFFLVFVLKILRSSVLILSVGFRVSIIIIIFLLLLFLILDISCLVHFRKYFGLQFPPMWLGMRRKVTTGRLALLKNLFVKVWGGKFVRAYSWVDIFRVGAFAKIETCFFHYLKYKHSLHFCAFYMPFIFFLTATYGLSLCDCILDVSYAFIFISNCILKI